MTPGPSICVVVPVYNHALTVRNVVRGARREFPVIIVNDGSTDQTAAVLETERDITLVALPCNQGKGAALAAGFARAGELGFTHAITIDADGQHPVSAIAALGEACREQPEALITGVRDLVAARAPWARRFTNALSTFWFRFETGIDLRDTQCGFRVYPLAAVRSLHIRSDRYAYELEVLVKAAWAGVPLHGQTVPADYTAPSSRLSHIRPVKDFLSISRLHARLTMQTVCLPAPLRALLACGTLRSLPEGRRLRTVMRHLLTEHTERPSRLALAVGAGLFCGIAPVWGGQMLAAVLLAHRFRLNKTIAVTASNISFPLAAPFILAAGLMLGNFLWTGRWMHFEPGWAARQIPAYFCQWLAGSLVLAVLVGTVGAAATFIAARVLRPSKNAARTRS